jgi:hypothetical protein
MSTKWKAVVAVAALLVTAPVTNTFALHRNLAAGEWNVKQLLLLMDQDRNGKVSRAEYMRFMAEEFDRLDVNRDGDLDVKELMGLRVHSRYSPPRR